MKHGLVFLVEMGLVFGLVLAWAIWEVVSLRRSQARDRRLTQEAVHHSEHSEGTENTAGSSGVQVADR